MKNIVLVTGGFDPIHSGHIAYLRAARKLGNILVVGVNSDAWLERKKGRAFMPQAERCEILRSITGVDFVITFDDSDGSACDAINMVRASYPRDRIVFANGGDRTQSNIPEMMVEDPNLDFQFGIGGEDKKNSSSWILSEWKAPKTIRPWGYYRVLHEVPGTKVKELTVNPGESLSMQCHQHRSEYWHVAEGECKVIIIRNDQQQLVATLKTHSDLEIAQGDWHQLTNPYDTPCKVVEIQFGTECIEDDIERK